MPGHEQRLRDEERAKAMALFNRTVLLDTSQCQLPPVELGLFASAPWEIDELQATKSQLEATKDKLDNMDNREWDKLAGFMDRAAEVKFQIRRRFQVELGTVAWAKMFEILASFPLLTEPSPAVPHPPILSVHLCEAPGAFICATNHYIKTKHCHWEWDWMASSLNPYYEGNDQFAMNDDDKLISVTLDRWCWGADHSGDIRDPANVRAVWAAAGKRASAIHTPGAMLVTADGGVDCSMDPNRQEQISTPLHLSEITAAVGVLAPGGNLVYKAFTQFHHSSICLLHLMGCLFDKVSLFKPGTSKSANSELYVVGLGFRGASQQLLDSLVSHSDKLSNPFSDHAMFSRDQLPDDFLASVQSAACYFAQFTCSSISEALTRLGRTTEQDKAALKEAKTWFAEEWVRRTGLQRLPRHLLLAPDQLLDGSSNNTSNVVQRRRELEGRLQDRREQYMQRREQHGLGAGFLNTTHPPDAETTEQEAQGPQAAGNQAGRQVTSNSCLETPGPTLPSVMPQHLSACAAAAAASPPAGRPSSLWDGRPSSRGSGSWRRTGPPPGSSSLTHEVGSWGSSWGVGPLTNWAELEPAGAVDWGPAPDSLMLRNRQPLTAAEIQEWSITTQVPPVRIIKSKCIPDDMVLAGLRAIRQEAARLSSSSGLGVRRLSVCSHTGPCVAPRSGQGKSRGYWKFAGLDAAAGVLAGLPAGRAVQASDTQQVVAPPAAAQLSTGPIPGALASGQAASGEHSSQAASGEHSSRPPVLPQAPATAKPFPLHPDAPPFVPTCIASSLASTSQPMLMPSVLPQSPGNMSSLGGSQPAQPIAASLTSHLVTQEGQGQLQAASAFPGASEASSRMSIAAQVAGGARPAPGIVNDAGSSASGPGCMCVLDLSLQPHKQQQQEQQEQEVPGFAKYLEEKRPGSWQLQRAWQVLCQPGSCQAGADLSPESSRRVATQAGAPVLVVGSLCALRHVTSPASSHGVLELEHDLLYRQHLVWEVATSLQCVAPGGCLVLRLADSLTMFTLGLQYLLYRCFASVCLVKPFSSCACSKERFLVCQGRLEDDGAAATHALTVLQQLCDAAQATQEAGAAAQQQAGSTAIAEIVQAKAMLGDQRFYEYVAGRTQRLAKREMSYLQAALLRLMGSKELEAVLLSGGPTGAGQDDEEEEEEDVVGTLDPDEASPLQADNHMLAGRQQGALQLGGAGGWQGLTGPHAQRVAPLVVDASKVLQVQQQAMQALDNGAAGPRSQPMGKASFVSGQGKAQLAGRISASSRRSSGYGMMGSSPISGTHRLPPAPAHLMGSSPPSQLCGMRGAGPAPGTSLPHGPGSVGHGSSPLYGSSYRSSTGVLGTSPQTAAEMLHSSWGHSSARKSKGPGKQGSKEGRWTGWGKHDDRDDRDWFAKRKGVEGQGVGSPHLSASLPAAAGPGFAWMSSPPGAGGGGGVGASEDEEAGWSVQHSRRHRNSKPDSDMLPHGKGSYEQGKGAQRSHPHPHHPHHLPGSSLDRQQACSSAAGVPAAGSSLPNKPSLHMHGFMKAKQRAA